MCSAVSGHSRAEGGRRPFLTLTQLEVESIGKHVNRRPVPRHDGAIAVSATLFWARGTHGHGPRGAVRVET
jgi:hypothetical protein